MAEHETPKVGDVFFVKDRSGMYRRTVGRVTPAGKIEFPQRPGMLWQRGKFSGAWEVAGGGWNYRMASAYPATPELEAEYRAHAVRLRIESLASDIAKAVRTSTAIPPKGTVPALESILAELSGPKVE